jgi:hypothetical protein
MEKFMRRNHSAAALQQWVCDLLSIKGLKVLLTVALPVLVSQLAKLTLSA